MSRVRAVPQGPTGTAPVPVVGARAPLPANGDPRLRSAPPMLLRAPEPVPPKPTEFAPPPAASRPRRPRSAFAAVLAVVGLALVYGLPAFGGETFAAPPVAGVHDAGDMQGLAVGDVADAQASADAITGDLAVQTAPGWVVPVAGRLGDPFGPRPAQPVPGVSLFHRGQDIVAHCGTPIHAAAGGVVQTANWWGTYGNWILVDHGGGVATGYAHEMRILVSVGQHVKAGQVIGLVGETGAATGCHLHLEVHLHGVAVNPVPFFAAKHLPLG